MKKKTCKQVVFELECVMTAGECIEVFGLSDSTVRNAIKRGKIPGRKSGGTWIVRREDAERIWSLKDLGL